MAHWVLLVEDDEDVREGLRAVLKSQGFDVECASDGVEALRILWRGFTPSLILLDVMLPAGRRLRVPEPSARQCAVGRHSCHRRVCAE